MKILYLITKSEVGGAQIHVADLCHYFKEKGNEVTVMSRSGGWLEEECKKIGIDFVINKFFSNSANPINIFKAINEIRKFVNEFKPDIIHCHSSAAAFFGRMAVRGKIRTIYTAHGWGFNLGMKPWIKYPVLFLEKICANYTDTYICVAEFVKKLGLKYNLAPENKFKVIYNGVAIVPQIGSLKSKGDNVNLVFIGRLAEPKKPELTIEAISLLPEEVKNRIKFTIIGDGPKRKMLKKMIDKIKVNVDFKIFTHEQAMADLEREDIFVFVSVWEGFPYTILEAMSRGLPVIASDVGGISEVINETTGILVENEVGQVREAILKLIDNKDKRKEMGEKGRETVQRNFTKDKMFKKIEEIYKGF